MIDRSEAEREITGLLFRYCELIDSGDVEGFANLFEHGVWFRAQPGAEGVRRFLAEHVRFYDGSPRTTHVTTQLVLDIDLDAGCASAHSTMLLYQGLPDFPLQLIMTSRCDDTFEHDGRWLWRRRRVTPILTGDMTRHAR